MRSRAKPNSSSRLLRVGMVIPAEKECGVYTYSHFLSEALSAQKSIHLELTPNTSSNDISSYASFARELEKKFDVIHIQHEFGRFGKIFFSGIGTPFLYSGFSTNAPVITTLHELPQTKNPLVEWVQHYFLRSIVHSSARVIVHTQHMQHALQEWFPAHARKITLIPHGMYIPPSRSTSKRPPFLLDKKVIGFFGFLSPHKNVEALIDALSHLPPEYVLLIAGSERGNHAGEYTRALHDLANEKGVSDRIQWEGFVPEEKMADVFSWMDVVIFPYRSVTESGALHLALGHEKIVIASSLPAFEEVAREYNCILTYTSPEDLREKIIRSITHAQTRQTLHRSLRAFTQARKWETVAKVHVAEYQNVSQDHSVFKTGKDGV